MTKSLRERLMAEAVDAPYDGDVAAVLTPGEAIHIFADWLESPETLGVLSQAIDRGIGPMAIQDALSRTIRGE